MKGILLSSIFSTAVCLTCTTALADTPLATFDENFAMDGLFAWSDAIVESTANGYSIIDRGYGSGYKNITPNIDASDETTIELTVRVSGQGAAANAPVSGPIVSLVDTDGTFYNFAWYGRTTGRHVLTAPLSSPTSVQAPGSTPGLNLAALDFFHLQDDPGDFAGTYTIVFERLRLIGAPAMRIASARLERASNELTITWNSKAGRMYNILYSSNLLTPFEAVQTDIAAEGAATTNSIVLPPGESGFVRVQEQQQ